MDAGELRTGADQGEVDLYDLTVTDLGEDAAAFAAHQESGGSTCSCGCMGGPSNCN